MMDTMLTAFVKCTATGRACSYSSVSEDEEDAGEGGGDGHEWPWGKGSC